MLLTTKNSKKYLENYHYINVPRSSIIATTLLHLFLLNLGMVLLYYYFAPAGGLILAYEIFYMISFVRVIWIRSGYSQTLFFIILAISVIADFFLAFLERWVISELFNYIIGRFGGY